MKKNIKLLLLFCIINLTSCENEPVEIVNIKAEDVIEVNSELYNTIRFIADEEPSNTSACIEFVYNFTIIVYDSNLEIIDIEIMHSDQEFIILLDSIEEGDSISLSYPITSTLENGELLIINNNEELKENLDKCLKEETIGYCNAILEDCIWKVAYLEGGNNDYEDAYFEISPMGNIWFHYNEEVILGTWISLFIEDELHLNINLIDTEVVGANWNFNWKVTYLTPDEMELFNGESYFKIVKECFSPCKQLVFEECEIEPDSGLAEFNLESYIECFLPFTTIKNVFEYTITFYETYEDASEGANSINSTSYNNTENPQEIFVRFENNQTGNTATILTIYIAAVSCY
ncbi:MAG: hypothetical protein L3J09_12615 [Flavobacteriaceae bacterium]|nr:hypothetical protein [Flavobacteriaceae bacterium]